MDESAIGGVLTGRRPVSPSGRPLDASMSLLREVMEHPLEPEYALVASRERPRAPRVLGVTLVLALVGGLAFGFSVAGLQDRASAVNQTREVLQKEILRRTAVAERLQASNESLNAQITREQGRLLDDAADRSLADEVGRLGIAAGDVAVQGPGLRLVLDDAPAADASAVGQDPRDNDKDEGRVLDRDLQIVVNGLWAAGAEAIAVNGQRLTSTSAIRSAGLAILVDFRPLVRPYVVSAIGDPDRLQSGFAADMAGSYVQSLRDNYGVSASMQQQKSLSLPGAGSLQLRLARPDPSPAPSTSASPTAPSPTPTAPRAGESP